MPTIRVKPQLATLVPEIPSGGNWQYEIKYDGYRILAHVEKGSVKFLTRNLLDWTGKFIFAEKTLLNFPPDSILDGEIVALNEKKQISFAALQQTLSGEADYPLRYYIFDLPFFRGTDLRQRSLEERRSILEKHFRPSAQVALAPVYKQSQLGTLIKKIEREKLEGLIAKDIKARYQEKRSRNWLKYKLNRREEFCIIGFTPHSKRIGMIGALLLGLHLPRKNVWYCGKVGTGFSDHERMELFNELSRTCESLPNIVNLSLLPANARVCRPRMVCEVEYTEWTPDGALRHPRFVVARADKRPAEVTVKGSGLAAIVMEHQEHQAI